MPRSPVFDIDPEKSGFEKSAGTIVETPVLDANDGVRRSGGFIGKLWDIVLFLDSYGVEVRGVERVPEDDRPHTSFKDAGLFWMSANLTISTFSLGTLSKTVFHMGLTDACLVIVFFNLIFTIFASLFSVWGMKTGLRQMMIGRYSFGWLGVYVPVILNCIACLGWSTMNTIVGAMALRSVAGHGSHALPVWAGVLIIALLTLAVALFGYKIVHKFERYASIPVFIISIFILGLSAPHVTPSISPPGDATIGSVLSFGATVAGYALGWTSMAADYTVNFPEDGPAKRVFLYVYTGLNVPLIFLEVLGAVLMATLENKTAWADAYADFGLGGLIGAPLSAWGGFGKFLLVILALSIVANNIPNIYSFALTFQSFGKYIQMVPRMFLVIMGSAIYIVLAIVGYNYFESFLHTLLLLLAYWLAIYCTILIEEHVIFRGCSFSNYELDSYDDRNFLPLGWGAIGAFLCGFVGALLGMSTEWYVGPLAKKIGVLPFGADIGFELAAAFTMVVYPVTRGLERSHTGK